MPLVFSPLSEEVLNAPTARLFPRHAFVMRQIGSPPDIDTTIYRATVAAFGNHDMASLDADATTGSKDFLARILELIRSTGFTVAIFSHETRPGSMANIMLELGFAAMCGKPLLIIKSKQAAAPSDLKRTDWIEYDEVDETEFARKIGQAVDMLQGIQELDATLVEVALQANCPDCAIAFERAYRGFLLSGDKSFIDNARKILLLLEQIDGHGRIADLDRQRFEIRTFIRQAEKALATTSRTT